MICSCSDSHMSGNLRERCPPLKPFVFCIFSRIVARMNLLPFGELPVHTPRKLLPAKIDLGDWNQVAPLFDAMEQKLASANSVAELERALIDWSEHSAEIDEEGSKRYIGMTCHTDNTDAEKAYLHFVENMEPRIKPRQFKLEQLYLAQPFRAQLPTHRYEVFDRDT